jgi:hypothetical protein
LNDTSTSIYARLLSWAVRAGIVVLALAFVAELAGFMRDIPLERMPEVWSAPAAAHGRGAWSAVLVAIAWLASCSVACLVPLLPILRGRGENALVAICILQILVVAFAAFGGSLAR